MAPRKRANTLELDTVSPDSAEPDKSDGPTHAREAQLAELDARDDRLNGHGVRPSEQCGVVAGSGPYPGRRCTFAKHDNNQPHSWETLPWENPEASSVASSTDDSTGQGTLPGTPEPEQNEYSVPNESSFGKAKSLPAPGVKLIAERLIADDDTLEHLVGVEIRYAWRRRGGTQGGNPRFARIKRPSFWEEHLTGGKVDLLLDVSADHVREQCFTERQLQAAVHEQLCRTERDEDDHDAFRIAGPDFSGSIRTLDRFGAWRDDLREAAAHIRLLPLDEALTEADGEESDGADEESD
jgi:hypothetical protein